MRARSPIARRTIAALAYGLLLLSCGDPSSPGSTAVARLTATPPSLQLSVGATSTIAASVLDEGGTVISDARIFWSVEHPEVATVTQNGVVTGVSAGTTRIALSSRGLSTIVPVTISALPVSLVRVTPSTASLRVGATTTLLAEGLDAAGEPVPSRPITWSSSAVGVATVSTNGTVTGVSSGVATITATIDGVTGSALVTVESVPVAAVRVSPDVGALLAGESLQLSAIPTDSSGATLAGRLVSWSSSAPTIASVSSTGLVNAFAAGSVTITATVEGKTGTARLTVSRVPVNSILVTPSALTLTTGRTVRLTAQALDSAGRELAGRAITWSSDNATVASVASDGTVTALAPGRAELSASAEGKVGTATIDVTPVPVASLVVAPTTLDLTVGSTQQVVATVRDSAGTVLTGRVVSWISGAPSVATVSQSGVVTAIGAGAALILATCEGQQATVALTVTIASVASIDIIPTSASIVEGQGRAFVASLLDAAGNQLFGRTQVWSSSDVSIATVTQSGSVTAIAPGTATITVAAPNAGPGGSTPSADAAVTVTYAPVTTATISPSAPTVTVGGTAQLTATLQGASPAVTLSPTGRTLSWSVADPLVASVSSSGLVTGIVPGNTTITLSASSPGQATPVTATVPLTVGTVAVAAVSVSAPSTTLTVGTTVQATATARDAAGNTLSLSGRTVVWTSGTPSVATVSSTGVVSAIAAGNATISVTVDGVGPATLPVTVVPPVVVPAQVATVSVAAPDSSLTTGTTVQATVVALDAQGNILSLTGRTVAWSSSAAGVASVSTSGLVSAIAVGTATIDVLVDGVGPASFPLVVTPPPVASVSATSPDSSLTTGTTVQATVVALDAQGNTLSLTGRTVVWSSNASGVASVAPNGVVTAVAAGNATISVTVDGVGPATIPISVAPVPVASVTVTPASPSLIERGTVALTATPRDAAGNPLPNTPVTWSVSNSKGSISTTSGSSTTLTALDSGVVIVSATSGGQTGSSTASIALIPVDTVESVPLASSPSISIRAGIGRNTTESFRAMSNSAGPLRGRQFSVSSSNALLGVAAVAGSNTTDSRGRGDFRVTLLAALPGSKFTVTVTVDGKSTDWQVTVR